MSPEAISERRERVIRLTGQGVTAPDIAAIERISVRTVARIRSHCGVPAGPIPRPLTADELAQAAALLDDGCCYEEVARTIGRSGRTIRRHFPGRAWDRSSSARFAIYTRWANERIAKVAV